MATRIYMLRHPLASQVVLLPGELGAGIQAGYVASRAMVNTDSLCVLDLGSSLAFSAFQDTGHSDFYKAVEKAAGDRPSDRSVWVYNPGRKTLSSGLRIYDASNYGDRAAELHLSVIKRYGTWRLRSPPGSPHCGHDVEIRPVGIMRKQETFVKDGTLYVWEMAMGGKRVLVGEFEARTWFRNSCVLVMDTKEVDDVIALGSCVAALNRDI